MACQRTFSKFFEHKTETERIKFAKENKELFEDGIGDLFFGLCRLANQLDVDIEEAFNMVKKRILEKYKNETGQEVNIVHSDGSIM